MPTVAEAMACFLQEHGIELMIGQSLPSALHLAAEGTGIRQIQIRTENAGTAMCDAYARISGRIAVMTAQNGPAATLLVPGLAEAMKASVPILAIVQEVDFELRDKNAFQEYDHVALFSSCSKWVGRLESGQRVFDYLNLALTQALSGRPGPAVLLVPAGVFGQPAPAAPNTLVRRSGYPLDRPCACRASISEAAAMLAQAERPLIISGGGVHASGAAPDLAALQMDFGIPVGTTLMGKGTVSEEAPLSLGVVGYLLGRMAPNRDVRDYVAKADVVMFVGTRTNQNGTDSWSLFRRDAHFIHIDIDGVEIGRNYDSLRLLGDAKSTLEGLRQVLAEIADRGAIERRTRALLDLIPARRSLNHCIQPTRSSAARPELIIDAINRHAPDNSILVADASYSSAWVCAYGMATRPGQRFITPRGLAGLGWGLPYAIGAKLASPEATVIGVSGDGGFAHVWGELEVLARYGLRVILVVLKNGVLGYQRDAELVKFGSHTNAIPINEIDHAALARAAGCMGLSAENQEVFEAALREALALDGPVVIDVRTDPSAYPPVTLLDALTAGGAQQRAPFGAT